jgi:hypothetical protein
MAPGLPELLLIFILLPKITDNAQWRSVCRN